MDSNITEVSRLNKSSYSRQLRTSVTFNIWELIANPTGKPSTAFVFNNNSECFFFSKKKPHPVTKTLSKKRKNFFFSSLSVCLLQTVNIQNNFRSRTKFSYFKKKTSTAYKVLSSRDYNWTNYKYNVYLLFWMVKRITVSPPPLKSFQHKYQEINNCPPHTHTLLYSSKGKNRPNRKS